VILLLVMDPVGNIPLFVSLLHDLEPARRNRIIMRECAIAFAVLLLFVVSGRFLLELLGLSESSLNIAGGVILFLIALRMIFRGKEPLFGDQIQGEPFIGYERDIPTRRETDRILRRHGVDVRDVQELDNIETIKRLVEIGTGLAILPEAAVRPEVKGKLLVAVQFSDEVFLRPTGIIHRSGKHFSPAAEKLIEYLRAE